MKPRNKTLRSLPLAAALAILALASTPANAAGTFAESLTTPPTIDGADIAWLDPTPAAALGLDKWFAENSGAGQTKGQSFTTTSDVLLNAVTYRTGPTSHGAVTKVYVVRVGAIDTVTNTFHEIHSEEITQDVAWSDNSYGTFTLDTPLTLPTGGVYGIDVAMKSTTSGWQTGIPYITYSPATNPNTGGYKYTRPLDGGVTGSATPLVQPDASRDREFHLDMTATTIVDTTAPTLTSIDDQVGGGPIYEDQVQVAYLLTFDEAIDETTIGLADFENLGSGVSIDSVVSVAQTTPFPLPSVIKVVLGVSGTGTLNLGIVSGATIADKYANLVNSPVADGTEIVVNGGTNPGTGNRWWDLATTGITDGVSQGGTGNWNTTTTNWDRGFGFAAPLAWSNAGGDTAVFGGTAGTVTLDNDITLDGLTFGVADAGGSGYFIGDAAEDNTLTFGGSKTITLNATGANSNQDATIRAGVAGSPTLNIHGRANNSQFFALEPTSNVTMTLGTLNMFNNFGSNKQLRLGGPGSGNVVDQVTWTVTGNQLQVRKQDSTNGGADGSEWTINQDISLDDGKIYVDEGTLILGGTNNFCSHSIEIAAGSRIVLQGNWRIHDENEDFRVLSGGIVAPGGSVGTATFNWNSSRNDPSVGLVDLRTGSTYEWEVGASATDTIALTEPVANGNAELVVASGTTLKVIDAGGTPAAGDQLTVFTYAAGVVTPNTATLNANMNIDLTGTSWTGTPSFVNDGAGTIYVTGIDGGGGSSPFETWMAGFDFSGFTSPDLTPTGDPDLDDSTNLQEFAFGTDPTVSSSASIEYVAGGEVTAPGQPVAINLANPGVDFRAVFGRRKDYEAAGLTYTVQFSAGLDIWVDSAATPTVLTSSTGEIDAVSVPYPLFITTARGEEKPTFFRVAVSQTP